MAWNVCLSLGTRLSAQRYAILGTSSEDSKRDRVGRLLSTPRALLAVAILRFPGLPLIYFYNHRSADIFGSDVEVLVFFSLHMWLGGIAFAQVRTLRTIRTAPQDSGEFECPECPSFCDFAKFRDDLVQRFGCCLKVSSETLDCSSLVICMRV